VARSPVPLAARPSPRPGSPAPGRMKDNGNRGSRTCNRSVRRVTRQEWSCFAVPYPPGSCATS
jgi:hypothetical protein